MARDVDEQRLFEIVRRNFPKHRGRFLPETKMSEVIGWDSVSHVAMLLDVEDAFGISIAEEDYFNLTQLGTILARLRAGQE